MADPITATAIATLLVQELAKSSAGEAGKKLVGDLWGAIARRFKGDARAEKALEGAKTEPSEAATNKLAVYLDEEMEEPEFAAEIRQLAEQIRQLQVAGKQEMATNLDLAGDLKAGNMGQRSMTREPTDQTMVSKVKAQNINLGDMTQEQ
jgi:hypothetical protein